jgi:hypothetical protein
MKSEALHCADKASRDNTHENTTRSHATIMKLQHVEASSGDSRAARGNAQMLPVHGAGEERRDRK